MTTIHGKDRSSKGHDNPMEISPSELSSSLPNSGFRWWPALLLIGLVVLLFMLLYNHSPQRKTDKVSVSSRGLAIPAAAVANGLSAGEKRDLLHMVEEEKLARDVYHFLHKKWGLSQFNSIARSEEQHVKAVLSMVQKYALSDPITGSRPGSFQDIHLAKLYEDLVSKGSRSAVDALQVGGMIEELDIIDLENAIKGTNQGDIRQVYQRIQRGSFNHLRSFSHALELVGQPYQPGQLSQASFDSIIHSPMVSGF
ncbi:MAG: DUF2202 domain-containing protein [Magnetococcales bacterium]|nr:DUF2202 domain-containing protein [Magnetococcales bacterium]